MSMDIIFETNADISSFKNSDFETDCSSLGCEIELHPEYEIFTDVMYFPFKVNGSLIAQELSEYFFYTGFEFVYTMNDNEKNANEFSKKKKNTLITRLLKSVLPSKPIDDTFQESDMEYRHSLFCYCHDELEVLCALLFTGYFLRTYGGIAMDSYEGITYSQYDSWLKKTNALKDEVERKYRSKSMPLNKFEKWL